MPPLVRELSDWDCPAPSPTMILDISSSDRLACYYWKDESFNMAVTA